VDDFDLARAMMLGQQLLDSGRPSEAADLAGAMLAHGESADALVLLSFALRSLGRKDEALTVAGRATTLEPDHLGAWTALALAYQALGVRSTAVWAAEERVRLAPDDWFSHALKSELIDEWSMAPEGLAAAEEAVRLAPDNSLAHQAVGTSHLLRRSRRKARASFEEALRLDPQNLGAQQNLAVLGVATAPGDTASDLMDVARADPQNRLVAYNLRISLARVLGGTWYLVLAGAVLSFMTMGVRSSVGLTEVGGRVIQFALAAVVIGVVLLLCGRSLRSDRARKALRCALSADPNLVVLGAVLLIGLVGLIALAVLPAVGQLLVLFLIYPLLWVIGTIAIWTWRLNINQAEREL
jgi:tetratricopeptide (TPR) repeat protein